MYTLSAAPGNIGEDHSIHQHSRYPNDNINILQGGKDYFLELLQLIGSAERTIHLQAYIFAEDSTGQMVANALMAAAARNVNVYLVADGFASQIMSQYFIDTLRKAGVHFRFFEPLLHSDHFYIGRRLHHKVFVVDSGYALVGGLNIADRYNDLPGQPAWLDFALSVEGEVAAELADICWQIWCGYPKVTSKSFEKRSAPEKKILSPEHPVQISRNDWVRKKNDISETYCQMLTHATSHITIVCSYFLPGKTLRKHLRLAAAKGIKITLVTAGVSDVRIAKMAERWMYDWLLRNNICLYEYQSTVLHAKLAVCDDQWLTLGSYNINDISAYASVELNLNVLDPFICKRISGMLNDLVLTECTQVTALNLKTQNNLLKQFSRFVAYEVIRLIFHTLTFYFRQRN